MARQSVVLVVLLTTATLATLSRPIDAQSSGDDDDCVYTPTTCSCSEKAPTAGSTCVRLLSFLPGSAVAGACFSTGCQPGFHCDCNGSKMCTRKKCAHWTADAPAGAGDSGFACSLSEEDCVVEDVQEVPQGATQPPPPAAATTVPETTVPETTVPVTTTEATTTTTTTAATTTTKQLCVNKKCPPCFVPSESCETCIAGMSSTTILLASWLASFVSITIFEFSFFLLLTPTVCGFVFFLYSSFWFATDTSIEENTALSCDICNSFEEFCPAGKRCCANDSVCRATTLLLRGLRPTTLAYVCSERCDGACDAADAGTCTPYAADPVELPTAPVGAGQIGSIPLCAR